MCHFIYTLGSRWEVSLHDFKSFEAVFRAVKNYNYLHVLEMSGIFSVSLFSTGLFISQRVQRGPRLPVGLKQLVVD